MNINAKPLPETVKPGDDLEIQLAPFGDYPGVLMATDPKTGKPTKKPIVQRLDAAALATVVNSFSDEVLVDRDHLSERGEDSSALAWVKRLRVDAKDGLMAVLNFTPPGAELVSGRVFRFPSAAFDIAEDADGKTVRPTRLSSVALTNKNNLPVRCVLNRSEPEDNTHVEENEGNQKMEEIATLLGVENDATAIKAAITALKQRATDAEAQVQNTEADKFVEENKGKVENSAALREMFLANPEQTKKFVSLIPATPAVATAKRVTNSTEAAPRATVDRGDVLKVYNSMTDGEEKAKFLSANAVAIAEARAAADED